jgi:hypothetical protein
MFAQVLIYIVSSRCEVNSHLVYFYIQYTTVGTSLTGKPNMKTYACRLSSQNLNVIMLPRHRDVKESAHEAGHGAHVELGLGVNFVRTGSGSAERP